MFLLGDTNSNKNNTAAGSPSTAGLSGSQSREGLARLHNMQVGLCHSRIYGNGEPDVHFHKTLLSEI